MYQLTWINLQREFVRTDLQVRTLCRIRHHLKHNLWRKNSHVIIVGFQAMSTPGRALVNGAKVFKMDGEDIAVKATIHTLGGFSAHADQSQLLAWAETFKIPRPRLYLVHSEANASLTRGGPQISQAKVKP